MIPACLTLALALLMLAYTIVNGRRINRIIRETQRKMDEARTQ